MELDEAIRTTRAMRRLDHDKAVSEEDLWTILDAASKAATGGNAQPVRWIVVDPASVFPGVENLFLAARQLGLGTTLTTVHRSMEDEVRAVLDIPDDVTTWAMIPVGHPTGRWGEAQRRPIEEITYWDGWRATRARSGSEVGD